MQSGNVTGLKIAVIGTGISGLSAAWMLQKNHDVTVFERAERLGGHSNTVAVNSASTGHSDAAPLWVDTGFIVYNEVTYPNLTALFRLLGIATQTTEMSFGVSLDNGRMEYAGTNLLGMFAQRRNLLRPSYLGMLRDLVRFYRDAPRHAASLDESVTLGDYLAMHGYGAAFRDDHLLPMAAAVWSSPAQDMMHYPAVSFIRFQENHGLLKLTGRPQWRTVKGGSRVYVEALAKPLAGRIRLNAGTVAIRRHADGVDIEDRNGKVERFDHAVLACHADQALGLLADPTPQERSLLGAFRYSRNLAVLHSDATLMPRRRRAWSAWNYLGGADKVQTHVSVTYWMNLLQNLPGKRNLFVSLNPPRPPHAGTIHFSESYEHPIFDKAAMRAQRELWSLQGGARTWYCGAYFGAGFHEDGLQAGLAVAEELGGAKRPWIVANESGRIHVRTDTPLSPEPVA